MDALRSEWHLRGSFYPTYCLSSLVKTADDVSGIFWGDQAHAAN